MATPGDYSCLDHVDVQIRQSAMWNNPRTNRKFNYDLATLICVLDNQNVSFPDQLLDNSCDTVRIGFLSSCDDTLDPCCIADGAEADWSCEIPKTGVQPGADCFEYAPNFCVSKTITIFDDECKGEWTPAEKMAFEMNKQKAVFAKALQDFIISTLCAKAVLPADTGGYSPNAGGTAIEIPKALATDDIMWDLQNIADQARFMDYMVLTGQLMAKQMYNADKGACCPNEGARNKFSDVQWCVNKRDFDQVIGIPSLILWEKGSTGFFNTFQWNNFDPQNLGDEHNTHVWRESLTVGGLDANGNLTGTPLTYANGNGTETVYLDVEEQRRCIIVTKPNGQCERRLCTSRRLRLRAGIACAPPDCDGQTGIIKIECKA